MLNFARLNKAVYLEPPIGSTNIIRLDEPKFQGWRMTALPYGLQLESPSGTFFIVPSHSIEMMSGTTGKK